jgi:hypothetical protein
MSSWEAILAMRPDIALTQIWTVCAELLLDRFVDALGEAVTNAFACPKVSRFDAVEEALPSKSNTRTGMSDTFVPGVKNFSAWPEAEAAPPSKKLFS